MLISPKNPITDVISVEHMCWDGGVFDVKQRSYSALAFRTRGSADITVGKAHYTVREGEVLYLPQGIQYHAVYTDTDMLVIHFHTLYNDPRLAVYSARPSEQLHGDFLQALSVWKAKKPAYLLQTMSLLYKIFGTLQESTAQEGLPPAFRKTVALLNAEYRDPELSVAAICGRGGISETAFRATFKGCYAKTPIAYVTELRLEHARRMLCDGATVETAALSSGFHDPKYFARVVKRRLGCTPQELKKYGN